MGAEHMKDMRGVCLAELAIGIAIAILVLGGLLEVLHLAQKAVGAKQRTIAQQQDVRIGLEIFEQEVRLATAESFVSAASHTVEFFANLHARHTSTTATVVPGQSVLPVVDGSGWGKGKTIAICTNLFCETHRLSGTGQRNQLTLETPMEGTFPAGASVELNNRVVYYTKTDEKGTISLMRMVDGGANVLVGELERVRFAYRDKRGRPTDRPSKVAQVLIDIKPRNTRKGDTRSVALRS